MDVTEHKVRLRTLALKSESGNKYVTITEWPSMEGYDFQFESPKEIKQISLTDDELDALVVLWRGFFMELPKKSGNN